MGAKKRAVRAIENVDGRAGTGINLQQTCLSIGHDEVEGDEAPQPEFGCDRLRRVHHLRFRPCVDPGGAGGACVAVGTRAAADGALYVAFSAEIAQVTPTVADWTQAQSVTVDVPSGQTDVVSTPEGLYLLNGQAIAFVFGDEPELPFRLVRLLAMFE